MPYPGVDQFQSLTQGIKNIFLIIFLEAYYKILSQHNTDLLDLNAGAAVGFTLYAVLFGLGTFAYRTLYVQR